MDEKEQNKKVRYVVKGELSDFGAAARELERKLEESNRAPTSEEREEFGRMVEEMFCKFAQQQCKQEDENKTEDGDNG